MNRFWLDVLPGGTVVLGGLMLMWSGNRMSGTVASWMAMAGGAWFAVGPAISRLWEHGAGPIGAPLFGHPRQTFELIGYFYGLGIVVMGLAAFALGRIVTKPALVAVPVDERPAATSSQPVAEEPMTAGGEPVVAGAPHTSPIARRRPITGAPADSTASRRVDEQATTESESVPAHH
jgi:hypothetical protein